MGYCWQSLSVRIKSSFRRSRIKKTYLQLYVRKFVETTEDLICTYCKVVVVLAEYKQKICVFAYVPRNPAILELT